MAHRYIGRNIYELRKKRGWSQSDLARKLDKKVSTISSYETDSKTPSVDTIIAMSELFGVSIDELFHTQIGVGNRLDGGRRCVKKYLWSFLRTAPAGQVRL